MIGTYTLRNTTYKPKKDEGFGLVPGLGLDNFSFIYKSSWFFYDTKYSLSFIKDVISDVSKIKQVTFGGQKYNYIDGILKAIALPGSRYIVYRDGSFDINKKNYKFPNLSNIIPRIRDSYYPFEKAFSSKQNSFILLLDTGDLVLVNLYKQEITTLLTGVEKFIKKHYGFYNEAIVGLKNGDMYQVWNSVKKIQDIKHTDIIFCTIGSSAKLCTVCFKNDTNKLYYFDTFNSESLKILKTLAITLLPNEYIIDGDVFKSTMFLITNKRLFYKYVDTLNNFVDGEWFIDFYPPNPTSSNTILKAKKIISETMLYSVLIEDMDGKYWITTNDGTYATPPKPYTYYDALKDNLKIIRESNL